MKQQAILLCGSNLGDKRQLLDLAGTNIKQNVGEITAMSSIYESEPWGFESENSFLNRVLIISTKLAPEDLLTVLQGIEKDMGRQASETGFSSRPIDIDILFYNDLIFHNKFLKIPHPAIQRRMFTLMPLCEIIPDFIHPVFNANLQNLMEKCDDKLWVKKL